MSDLSQIRTTSATNEIDLVSYLPDYLRASETETLVQFFENFLNELYSEQGTYFVDFSTSAISGSVTTSIVTSADQKISILEKVNRLADLHDPSLIDLDYIQYFANNLGYNIDVSRGELGILTSATEDLYTTSTSADNIENNNKYIRFVVENLPNWYRIKSTRNAARILLYSFGIIGDLYYYFVDDYSDFGSKILFKESETELSATIPDNYFPTPHFTVGIELDDSITDISFETQRRQTLVDAVESIRPANTVFESITGLLNRKLPTHNVRVRYQTYQYVYIPWDPL